MNPDWITAITAIFATFSAIAAAIAAWQAYRLQANVEGARIRLLKGEAELQNLQKYIVIFANIIATAKEEWSTERNEKLKLLSSDLRYTAIVMQSLSPEIGGKLEKWKLKKDSENNSVPRIVDFILASSGAAIGEEYDYFFKQKSAELREIQDEYFKSVSA